MDKRLLNLVIGLTLLVFTFLSSGCTIIFQKQRRADIEKISKLRNELSDLEKAKAELEARLQDEIADGQVKVESLAKGLVITFVAEVLFDAGKAELRAGAPEKLDKVAGVINTTVRDLNIGIEGHTDSDPIKFSGWKSNWELSSARALTVLHYLIDSSSVSPERLAAIGYGEHRPVAENTSKEGKQKNRRVEIVILPKVEKEGK